MCRCSTTSWNLTVSKNENELGYLLCAHCFVFMIYFSRKQHSIGVGCRNTRYSIKGDEAEGWCRWSSYSCLHLLLPLSPYPFPPPPLTYIQNLRAEPLTKPQTNSNQVQARQTSSHPVDSPSTTAPSPSSPPLPLIPTTTIATESILFKRAQRLWWWIE